MRKHTGGREILRPATTRFATNFIALQSILAQKNSSRGMVTSNEWTTSAYAREVKEKKSVEDVLDSGFWSKSADIVKLTEPLVRVLRMLNDLVFVRYNMRLENRYFYVYFSLTIYLSCYI